MIAEAREDHERVYDDEGVDRSLVRWMLSLSPTERLRLAEDAIAMVASVVRPSDVAR